MRCTATVNRTNRVRCTDSKQDKSGAPGFALQPSAEQVPLATNYITNFDFLNQYLHGFAAYAEAVASTSDGGHVVALKASRHAPSSATVLQLPKPKE